MDSNGYKIRSETIPAACPLCGGASNLTPENKKRLVLWRCSLCKGLFRVIVHEKGDAR
jgi:hypothetical protein